MRKRRPGGEQEWQSKSGMEGGHGMEDGMDGMMKDGTENGQLKAGKQKAGKEKVGKEKAGKETIANKSPRPWKWRKKEEQSGVANGCGWVSAGLLFDVCSANVCTIL